MSFEVYFVVKAGYEDTMRSLIYTGRPMRIIKNDYAVDWEENRREEMDKLLKKGTIPYTTDMARFQEMQKKENSDKLAGSYVASYDDALPKLSGFVAASIDDVKPAADIVNEMMEEAIEALKVNAGKIKMIPSKL